LLVWPAAAGAETGYDLWLRYRPVENPAPRSHYRAALGREGPEAYVIRSAPIGSRPVTVISSALIPDFGDFQHFSKRELKETT
jgi:hypothetical protein